MMILDRIIEVKQQEVEARKALAPVPALMEKARKGPPPRDFRGALGVRPCAVIAEVKRSSPSRGVLREDFNPIRIASLYEQNGAAAISVLTDETFFGGHGSYLAAIKEVVGLPLLRKDFIIDPYQVYETRALGGDALLLIAGILPEEELGAYMGLAASLGLASLVEVHDRAELEAALRCGAEIIGINNRDLRTFATNLETSLELAPLIPQDRMVVSESGIRTRSDIERLVAAGIGAFLIGEALMGAPDMGAKLRELVGP